MEEQRRWGGGNGVASAAWAGGAERVGGSGVVSAALGEGAEIAEGCWEVVE